MGRESNEPYKGEPEETGFDFIIEDPEEPEPIEAVEAIDDPVIDKGLTVSRQVAEATTSMDYENFGIQFNALPSEQLEGYFRAFSEIGFRKAFFELLDKAYLSSDCMSVLSEKLLSLTGLNIVTLGARSLDAVQNTLGSMQEKADSFSSRVDMLDKRAKSLSSDLKKISENLTAHWDEIFG